MTIISKKRLKEYWTEHPDSKKPLEDWYSAMKNNSFNTMPDLKLRFPTADYMSEWDRYCFNVHGNKYRLIVRITWGVTVFIVEVLTHTEYTKKYVDKRKRK
ncbi:MAG: type II toxin-antitoxin system HigB family toxin [Spirochaetales bacterium]|nr:type II toxin-antitoxin system HigB family toxin [Spirochaetales bacterium]